MNLERIQTIFHNLGKIIRLTEISTAAASGVKEHVVATHVQFSQSAAQTAGEDDYAALAIYLVPAQQRIQPVAAALDRVQMICKANTEAYLRTLAEELSLSATSPTANILSSLAAQMNLASGTIAPSGKMWSYFHSEFGFTGFPQNSSPTLPDSFITTTIL